jgi:peroxiredoxin Q/BCP
MLKEGMIAPEFTLPNEKGEEISLSNFRGKKVVLYFYSKDNTPGCTRQACAYAGAYALFEEKNAVVIGISKDSAASHEKFAAKHGLPFLLLADPEKEVHSLYGVLKEKTMYGKKTIGTERTTFLINEEGVLVGVRKKVNPDTDPAEVLALL